MVEMINRKLKGWAAFYQFVDFKAKVFSYIDRVVFWKLAHWLPICFGQIWPSIGTRDPDSGIRDRIVGIGDPVLRIPRFSL